MCIKKDILATLTYFDLFDYPLKQREIYIFLGIRHELAKFEVALNDLLNEAAIYKTGHFYSLQNDAGIAERRRKGNDKAASMLKKAARAGAIIGNFPFVRGVAVSGSLSKKFAGDNADIDFFIITAANRLWLARTFLHIFKKFTFLFNLQDSFCMNYFIDEAEPVILEKNIYTATEVVTILPLQGHASFDNFFAANNWTRQFLPNYNHHLTAKKETRKNWLVGAIEKLFNNRFGNAADDFFMNLTAKSWIKKTQRQKKNSKGLLMSMHTGKHFSKPDPGGFQKKLLQRYQHSLKEMLRQYESGLSFKKESK